jgi:VWA-like domain (DUF2201)
VNGVAILERRRSPEKSGILPDLPIAERGLRSRVDLPFEGATRAARTGRIALAVDTSGSIDESVLRRFAAEVAAVREKTELLLRLIVYDADVHQVYDFFGREGAKILRRFTFKGVRRNGFQADHSRSGEGEARSAHLPDRPAR